MEKAVRDGKGYGRFRCDFYLSIFVGPNEFQTSENCSPPTLSVFICKLHFNPQDLVYSSPKGAGSPLCSFELDTSLMLLSQLD